jgi:hypothetical protein
MEEAQRSKTRLNRIAFARLQAQGVEAHISADEMRVEGILRLGQGALFHPMSGAPITLVQFQVVGHNLLRILEPGEFKHLAPIEFFDLPDVFSIIAKLRLHLQSFGQLLEESDEETVDLSGPMSLQDADGEHKTEEISTLGLRLGTDSSSSASHAEVSQLQPVQPEIEAVTLGELLAKFGPDTVISGNAVYVRDFQIKDRRLRMSFWQKSARTFFGRLNEGEESLWEDIVELDRFPNADDFASMILDVPLSAEALPAELIDDDVPTHSEFKIPVVGERWAMQIVVEGEMGSEIRYVPIKTDGQPFGAARVLAQEIFLKTFAAVDGGHRLLVKVLEADVVRVSYVHLDAQGKATGKPKNAPTEAFKANFYHLFSDD